MATQIDPCSNCLCEIKTSREGCYLRLDRDDKVKDEIKDNVYMYECIQCKTVLVWIPIKNDDGRFYVEKAISKLDPEYIIWKLK